MNSVAKPPLANEMENPFSSSRNVGRKLVTLCQVNEYIVYATSNHRLRRFRSILSPVSCSPRSTPVSTVGDERARGGRIQPPADADDGRGEEEDRVDERAEEDKKPDEQQQQRRDEQRLSRETIRETAAGVLAERVHPPQDREPQSSLDWRDGQLVDDGRQQRRYHRTSHPEEQPPDRDGHEQSAGVAGQQVLVRIPAREQHIF